MAIRGSPLTRSLPLVWLCGLSVAWGQTAAPDPAAPEAPPPEPEESDLQPDESLSRHRTVFEALTERAIGRTSRRVRYDWRRGAVQVGATGGLPAELNNFDSLRAGGVVRYPTGGVLLGLGVSYVWVSGSESTDLLALTPYRQPGRPDRLELDFSLAYPLAEGVVTAVPRFLPSTELVLNAYGHFRYLVYPGGFADLGLADTLKAIVSGSLSDDEVENLEDERLPGMEIDRGRYALLFGLGGDLYFQSGFFITQKILIAVPVLRFLTDTRLGYGYELELALGFAF